MLFGWLKRNLGEGAELFSLSIYQLEAAQQSASATRVRSLNIA